jgi:ribosomal 50S subunit-associated protein YjgA (DUF615 family)
MNDSALDFTELGKVKYQRDQWGAAAVAFCATLKADIARFETLRRHFIREGDNRMAALCRSYAEANKAALGNHVWMEKCAQVLKSPSTL